MKTTRKADLQSIYEKHPQWPHVLDVLNTIVQAGHEALLAGGCVRDALLGRVSYDFDIATSATPAEVEALFPKVITVGRDFGVSMIPFNMEVRGQSVSGRVEVTTFRVDGPYRDGRRPEHVEFSSAEHDAERRDFTVNALFYDVQKQEVVDYVAGLEDLKKKVLRVVGRPEDRFREDKLRLMRLVRFHAQLGFVIERESLRVLKQMAREIEVVADERIEAEFVKLLMAKHRVQGLQKFKDSGLWEAIFTEPVFRFSKEDWANIESQIGGLGEGDRRVELLYALVFRPHAQTNAETIEHFLQRKKHKPQTLKGMRWIWQTAEEFVKHNVRLGEILKQFENPLMIDAIDFMRLNSSENSAKAAAWAEILERGQKLFDEQGRFVKPFLNGHDLKELGIAPGPEMKKQLEELFVLQLEEQLYSREAALQWVKNKMKI